MKEDNRSYYPIQEAKKTKDLVGLFTNAITVVLDIEGSKIEMDIVGDDYVFTTFNNHKPIVFKRNQRALHTIEKWIGSTLCLDSHYHN